MKRYKTILAAVAPVLLVAGYLAIPAALRAQAATDSAEINKLLVDARAEAVELKADSENMATFTRSTFSWQSYAGNLEMIRGHVNKSGELLTKLQNAKSSGSTWQQTAIDRIEPLLKEMAANTSAAIKHLSDNKSAVHMQTFRDYVKANYEIATDLEALIRDYANYGQHRENLERLSKKLEIS